MFSNPTPFSPRLAPGMDGSTFTGNQNCRERRRQSTINPVQLHFDMSVRRHSEMVSPVRLATHLNDMNLSAPSPTYSRHLSIPEVKYQAPAQKPVVPSSLTETSHAELLSGASQPELTTLTTTTTTVHKPSRLSQEASTPDEDGTKVISKSPSVHTPTQLRQWGNVYLGDSATADAFVRAVPIRRVSTCTEHMGSDNTLIKNGEDESEEAEGSKADEATGADKGKGMVIRARIVPRAKDRKPFVIQRSFDLDELKRNAPPPRLEESSSGTSTPIAPQPLQRERRNSRARSMAVGMHASRGEVKGVPVRKYPSPQSLNPT
jgi:hypothetical protein